MTDGTFTTASAVGAARVSFPIPGDYATRIIEQDFMILFANFAALALNTAHGSFATAYLIEETPLQDLGGGVARWTRVYSNIPANRSEYGTLGYNYIGFAGQLWTQLVNASNGRERFTKVSLARTDYVYYLPGVSGGITTVGDIPVIESDKYYVDGSNNVLTDYLGDPASGWSPGSVPSRADYEGLMDDDAASASSFSLIAEDSKIARWRGNIYERATVYVKAY